MTASRRHEAFGYDGDTLHRRLAMATRQRRPFRFGHRLDDHPEKPLHQPQRTSGVVMQKPILANTPEASRQHMPRSTTETGQSTAFSARARRCRNRCNETSSSAAGDPWPPDSTGSPHRDTDSATDTQRRSSAAYMAAIHDSATRQADGQRQTGPVQPVQQLRPKHHRQVAGIEQIPTLELAPLAA